MSTSSSTPADDRSAECEVNVIHPEALVHAQAALPSDERIEQATTQLKLVSDPTRFRVLHALASAELCVCDLAALAGIAESTMSHQLRLLRASGLVTFTKLGRVAYYRLADDHVRQLLAAVLLHTP